MVNFGNCFFFFSEETDFVFEYNFKLFCQQINLLKIVKLWSFFMSTQRSPKNGGNVFFFMYICFGKTEEID